MPPVAQARSRRLWQVIDWLSALAGEPPVAHFLIPARRDVSVQSRVSSAGAPSLYAARVQAARKRAGIVVPQATGAVMTSRSEQTGVIHGDGAVLD